MKKLVVLLAVLVCYSTAHAQLFDFGLRGGISSTNVKVEDTESLKEVDRSSEFGYHAGLFARINPPLIPLYVQPEVLFSSTGGTVSLEDVDNSQESEIDFNFNRIDVPVLVGLKFGLFRINAGPTFNLITKAEQSVDAGDFEEIKDYKNATIGYQAGVGLDIGPMLLDLKYEGSLSKYGESITIANQSFATDQRNRQLILSVGIKL